MAAAETVAAATPNAEALLPSPRHAGCCLATAGGAAVLAGLQMVASSKALSELPVSPGLSAATAGAAASPTGGTSDGVVHGGGAASCEISPSVQVLVLKLLACMLVSAGLQCMAPGRAEPWTTPPPWPTCICLID